MLPLRDNIPTSRTPYVTYVFIAANILVYFFWQKGGFSLRGPDSLHYQCQLLEWAATPDEFTGTPQPLPTECGPDDAPTLLTPFTSMFMHGGLLHLGGNMLFLWIFGNNVEDATGHVKFVLFYLLGGLVALALHVLTDLHSTTPTLGASGAIAAVLGRLRGVVPAGSRGDRDLHRVLLHDPGAAGAARARRLVPPAGAVGLDGRDGRRGLLRAHRRLPVRGTGHSSIRE